MTLWSTDVTRAEVPVSAATVPMLFRAIDDPLSPVNAVAEVVGSDVGLAAAVLAIANSAAFGRTRRVDDLHAAVALIGVDIVQTIAVAAATRLLDGSTGLPHVRPHAVETACAARLLARAVGLPESQAFAAGLLHDVGEILLWHAAPDAYAAAHAGWADIGEQLWTERSEFGEDHATVARAQLTDWGLPGNVVDAVGDHHRPDLRHRDLSTVVAAAEDMAAGDDAPDRLHLGPAKLRRIHPYLVREAEEVGALLRAAGGA